MNVSVETTSNLGRKLTIVVPVVDIETTKKDKLKKFASTVKIDGFRKGKIPPNFIQKKYGKQIHHEAISDLIGNSLQQAIEQENLRPAGPPMIDNIKDATGEDLQYIATFEIFPDIKLIDFKTLELEKYLVEITDADIEKGLKSLQEQFGSWTAVERAAANDDQIIIDFVGSIDGVPFKSGEGKDVPLELGGGRFIPGFEESLVGVKAGDVRVIDVTFPAEYGSAELAGKPAKFNVTVHSVSSKELAPVDAELAKKIGLEDGDVSKIKEKIKTNMEKTVAHMVKEKLKNQAVEKLVVINTFDIPLALLEKEKESLLKSDKQHKAMQALSPEQLTEEATKRICLGLLLNKIIEQYNIQPEKSRIDAKLSELATMFGGNVDLIQQIYSDSKELLANLRSAVLTDQAIDLVVGSATIKEKASNFYDIANLST